MSGQEDLDKRAHTSIPLPIFAPPSVLSPVPHILLTCPRCPRIGMVILSVGQTTSDSYQCITTLRISSILFIPVLFSPL